MAAAKKSMDMDFEDDVPEEQQSDDPVLDLEEEEEEEGDTEPEVPKPSRKDKKASRTWMNREDRERLEREAIEAKARAEATERSMLMLQQTLQRLPFGGQQQQQRDPIETELESIDEDRLNLEAEYRARLNDTKNLITPEEDKKFRQRALKLERRQTEAITARQIRNAGLRAPADEQQTIIRNYVATRYPEASQDQRAMLYAEGVQRQLVAQGKQPWATETIDAAMEAANKQFRYGKYKAGQPQEPDPVLRDRLQSTPRSSSAAAPTKGQKTITMTKEFRRMADAAYPHIKNEQERWKRWAKDQMED